MNRIPRIILLCLIAAPWVRASDFAAWLSHSISPDTRLSVRLDDQSSLSGVPIALDETVLTLRQRVGGGAVDRNLPRQRIRSVEILIAEADRDSWRAPQLMEALLPFLEYLLPEQTRMFDPQLDALLRLGAHRRAVNFARRLREVVRERDRLDAILAVEVLSLLALGQEDEAAGRCSEWIAGAPVAGPPALPWQVLASLHQKAGEQARARRAALHPLLFPSRGESPSAGAVDLNLGLMPMEALPDFLIDPESP